MAVACNLFVFFDAQYENRPAGPWPKHMHICLGMEPNHVHTNLTMNDRAEPKHVVPQISTTGMEPTHVQTRISPRHICGPLTSLAGHETHTHRAAVALLANSLPGQETHMHNAFIFNRGV